MANTAISTISTAIVRKGHPVIRWAEAAAATYIPGDWVYYSATGTVTAIATGTAACKLLKAMPLDYPARLHTDKSRKDIDDQIETSKVPVIWAGDPSPILIAATVEDPAGAALKGVGFMASNTVGDIELINSGTDPTSMFLPVYLWDDLANGDTVGQFLYY